jgi:hypothetical protein
MAVYPVRYFCDRSGYWLKGPVSLRFTIVQESKLPQQAIHLFPQFGKILRQAPRPGNHNNIITCPRIGFKVPERFAQPALCPVSLHRAADFFTGCKTQPVAGQTVTVAIQHKAGAHAAFTPRVQALEIAVLG